MFMQLTGGWDFVSKHALAFYCFAVCIRNNKNNKLFDFRVHSRTGIGRSVGNADKM